MVHFYDLNTCLEPGAENGKCYALSRGGDTLQLITSGDYVIVLSKDQSDSGAESALEFLRVYPNSYSQPTIISSIHSFTNSDAPPPPC